MNEPTITLGIIVKDEVELVTKLVNKALPHFEAIILTVSDKKASASLKRALSKEKGVTIYHRKWNNRFDDARNDNMSHVTTSHYMWVDSDDEFDFSQMGHIYKTLQDYDVVWLPYHYERDDNGNVIVEHWRERVLPMDKGFYWRGWVHENCLSEQSFTSKRLNIPVIHHSDHKKESEQRNHDILLEAYKATEDPRYIHYLGISYFSQRKWQEAIEILGQYIEVGGWDEEIYRSLLRMSEASAQLGNKDQAHQFVLQAIDLMPELPQAYFNIADLEFQDDNWKQCTEWLRVAFSKPQPETASIVDPTVPDKATLMAAICEFKLGNARDAEALIKTVKTVDVGDMGSIIAYEASIERAASILPALKKHYEDPKVLWDNLHPEIKYDNRFRKLRESVTEPRTWPDRSIVFFCGKGYEEWGPHTLDKGMGGSEEAIVYLSRELVKQGYDVTVFGSLSNPYNDYEQVVPPMASPEVKWLPWNQVDKRDTFDTLIIWRYPQFAPQFKAKRKFVDMHDLLPAKIVKPYKDVTYLFKSDFHASQYPEVTNFNVIGNGLKRSQFDAI